MNKSTNYIGIDISKEVFDVYDFRGEYHQFKNSYSGFKKMLKLSTVDSHFVMEATAYYHQKLAYFLIEQGIESYIPPHGTYKGGPEGFACHKEGNYWECIEDEYVTFRKQKKARSKTTISPSEVIVRTVR